MTFASGTSSTSGQPARLPRAGWWIGLALFLVAGTATAADRSGWVADELLVGVRPGVSRAAAENVYRSHGAAIADEIPQIRVHVIRVPVHALEAVEKGLSRRPEIEFVERNRILAPELTPNDPSYPNQWHLPKISASGAWKTSLGNGITIAILDTGVDSSHPDLAAKLVPGYNFYDNNTNTADVHGHGTKVAGAAAAIADNGTGVASVSWKSPLMPLRISDPNGYAYYSTIAKALTWAADRGVRVMNVSFNGVAASSTIRSAAEYVRGKNGVVVVAAGNCGCFDSTAENPYVISVAATDQNDGLASFSSRGEYVDLAAPGVNILTTVRGGGYGGSSGTSFASPVVAGVVALMMGANPALSPAGIEEILQSTALDLGAKGYDTSFGFGRVDAQGAVLAAGGTEPAPVDTTAPAVAVSSPSDGATVSGTVTVGVSAFDDVGVTRIELLVDDALFATASASPASFAWDTTRLADGVHSLRAYAYDAAGNRGTSDTVRVTVKNATADTTPPVVSILSPGDGDTVSKMLKIRVAASDDVQVQQIELDIDGAPYASASCSSTDCSTTFNWNTNRETRGAHTLEARAFDAAGSSSGSGAVTVYVK